MGTVRAVADVVGLLEYDWKSEKEERWRSYAEMVESLPRVVREGAPRNHHEQ
jgi:hypothetical protein